MQSRSALIGLVVAVMGFACGDSENLADPVLIASGGAGDGAIAGRVNVHVIDSDSDAPIASAEVIIGEPGEEPLTGRTNSAGLFTVDDGSLDGPTTITVVAADHVTTTWFGVNAVNVTIGVDAVDPATAIDSATLAGTITGWDEMATPADNHIRLALITYSQTDDLGAPENEIAQPSGGGGLPPNACYTTAAASACDWELTTRVGTIAVIALILDLDNKGTADEGDDTTEVVGLAYKLDLQVEDGVDQSGLALAQIAAADLDDIAINLPTTPSAFDSTMALVGVELGASGLMMMAIDTAEQESILLPAPVGDFAAITYRAIAIASAESDADDDDNNPMTGSLLYDLTDVSAGITFPDWLPTATALAVTQGEYSFTPVAEGVMHTASLREPSGDPVWEIALFDGRTSFTLPGVDPNPVPSGAVELSVTTFEADIDLMEFTTDELTDVMTRMARNRATLQ